MRRIDDIRLVKPLPVVEVNGVREDIGNVVVSHADWLWLVKEVDRLEADIGSIRKTHNTLWASHERDRIEIDSLKSKLLLARSKKRRHALRGRS